MQPARAATAGRFQRHADDIAVALPGWIQEGVAAGDSDWQMYIEMRTRGEGRKQDVVPQVPEVIRPDGVRLPCDRFHPDPHGNFRIYRRTDARPPAACS